MGHYGAHYGGNYDVATYDPETYATGIEVSAGGGSYAPSRSTTVIKGEMLSKHSITVLVRDEIRSRHGIAVCIEKSEIQSKHKITILVKSNIQSKHKLAV